MSRETVYECDYCGKTIEDCDDILEDDNGYDFCSTDCKDLYSSLQDQYKKET